MAESLGADVSGVALGDKEATLQKLRTESKAANSSTGTFQLETLFYNDGRIKQLFPYGEQMIWSAGTQGTSPVPISPQSSETSTHTGTLAGVKFGRVYVDSLEQLPTTRKFIVAFDSPANKAYAECGPIGPVDWNVVEVRLGNSGRVSVAVDDILGSRIEAGTFENATAYAIFYGE